MTAFLSLRRLTPKIKLQGQLEVRVLRKVKGVSKAPRASEVQVARVRRRKRLKSNLILLMSLSRNLHNKTYSHMHSMRTHLPKVPQNQVLINKTNTEQKTFSKLEEEKGLFLKSQSWVTELRTTMWTDLLPKFSRELTKRRVNQHPYLTSKWLT